jgi:hypothetical protein
MDPATRLPVASECWATTVDSADGLRKGLQEAVGSMDHKGTLEYCLEVLRWGGVSGAVGFLNLRTASGTLIRYLEDIKPALNVAAPKTAGLTPATVLRFDAGMTKIHSIVDGNWTPIFDSRVGAAIAMLFELYYASTGAARIAGLDFPSGAARGKQVRNPGYFLGLAPAPQFYTAAVTPEFWAQSQLRLAWVIEALLNRYPVLFSGLGAMGARAHAFEATLFMLGYDLRCFIPAMRCLGLRTGVQPVAAGVGIAGGAAPRGSTWMPTEICMTRVAELFLKYAATRHFTTLSVADFVRWQTLERSPAVAEEDAKGLATVLQPSEFDLCDRTEAEIRSICGGGRGGLQTAMAGRGASVDECERVCLVAALLFGTLRRRGLTRQEMIATTRANDLAWADGSAGTLLTVGRSVGGFFGLLDEGGAPTDSFAVFFSTPDYRDLLTELLPAG